MANPQVLVPAQLKIIDTVRKVDLIDFRPIVCKILSENSLEPSRIIPSIKNYKKFLSIGAAFKASIVPNIEEDTVWHTLHLDTDFYQLVSWFLERSPAIRHFGYIGIRGGNDKTILNHKYDRGRTLIEEYFIRDKNSQATNCIGQCKIGGSGCDIHIKDGILPVFLPELSEEKFLTIQNSLMCHRPPQAGFDFDIPFDLEEVNTPILGLLK